MARKMKNKKTDLPFEIPSLPTPPLDSDISNLFLPSLDIDDVFFQPYIVDDSVKRVDQILFGSEQLTLADSIAADVSDAMLSMLPIVGQYLQVSRITTSLKTDVFQEYVPLRGGRTAIYSLNFVCSAVPVVGFILDALVPANQITFIGNKMVNQKGHLLNIIGNLPLPAEDELLPFGDGKYLIPTLKELIGAK